MWPNCNIHENTETHLQQLTVKNKLLSYYLPGEKYCYIISVSLDPNINLVKCNLTKLTTTSLAIKRSKSLVIMRSKSLAVHKLSGQAVH